MVPEKLQFSDKGVRTSKSDILKENAGIWGSADFVKNGFVDHINTIKDTTDYLWHTTRFISETIKKVCHSFYTVLLTFGYIFSSG